MHAQPSPVGPSALIPPHILPCCLPSCHAQVWSAVPYGAAPTLHPASMPHHLFQLRWMHIVHTLGVLVMNQQVCGHRPGGSCMHDVHARDKARVTLVAAGAAAGVAGAAAATAACKALARRRQRQWPTRDCRQQHACMKTSATEVEVIAASAAMACS